MFRSRLGGKSKSNMIRDIKIHDWWGPRKTNLDKLKIKSGELQDLKKSNLDEWKIKFDNQKIVKTKFWWLEDQV